MCVWANSLGLPTSNGALLSLLKTQPHVQDGVAVPEYFGENDEIDDAKLPPYLKGLKVKLSDITITREEFNLFIYEAFVLAEGREELISLTNEPGCIKNFEVHAKVRECEPWHGRLRPADPKTKQAFSDVLDRYLKQGLIEESTSQLCATAMLVEKKGGRNQLACGFFDLNKNTIPFAYPLPLMNDCLDCLFKAKYLSSLDITGAYHSIPIAESSRDYFTFICHSGLFRWKRLPYGWRNSGPFFYKVMAVVFHGLMYNILCCYADDTLIFGGITFRGHVKCISLALTVAWLGGFHLSIVKCPFFVKELDYLGHTAVAAVNGIRPMTRNIEKMLKLEIEVVGDIRSFIGLSNFYRKFVKDYAKIVQPLNVYLCKNARLTKPLPADVTEAVKKIKDILCSYPVLRNPDFELPFILETDGSLEGFGAILKQIHDESECIVAYASSGIMASQRGLTSDLLEVIAAVWGMIHFRHYLRAKFTLKTDNVILKWLRGKDRLSNAMAKWIIGAQGYDFDVVHVPGRKLHGGDLMSRAGARNSSVCQKLEELDRIKYFAMVGKDHWTISGRNAQKQTDIVENLDRITWVKAQQADPMLQRMKNSSNGSNFVCKNGLWYHEFRERNAVKSLAPGVELAPRLVVPQSLRATLMVIAHGLTGHRGAKPLVRLLSRTLYWPGLWAYVRSWVRSCSDCRRRKDSAIRQPGLQQPHQGCKPWHIIAIDFPGGKLPVTDEGYTYILTVLCVFTRFPFAIPLKTKEAEEIGTALFEHVFSVFGFPAIVHSDNEPVLLADSLNFVFSRFNIGRTFSILGHPESNAHVERFHRYLNESLTIILPKYTDWPRLLPVVLMAYRGVVHETTGYSPHFLNCGREMRLPLEVTWGTVDGGSLFDPPPVAAVQNYAEALVARLQAAFKMVRRAQLLVSGLNRDRVQMSDSAVKFQVGDPVYLKEHSPTHRADGAMRSGHQSVIGVPRKWLFVWTGPHIVLKTDVASCTIYHSQRRQEVRAHVSDLRLHHPFSAEVFDTAVTSSYTPPHTDPPPEGFCADFPSPDATLKPGQLCVVYIPSFAPEDLCILRYMGNDQYQWYSNWSRHDPARPRRSSIEIFARTAWLPGWVTYFDNKVVYSYRRPSHNCGIFTAEARELTAVNFIVWGFELNTSNRVKAPLVEWIADRIKKLVSQTHAQTSSADPQTQQAIGPGSCPR